MESEYTSTYSDEFRRTLTPEVISKIKTEVSDKSIGIIKTNALDIVSGFIPVLGLLKSRTSFQSYRDSRIGMKLINFLEALSQEDYNYDSINEMAKELEEINHETLYETLLDTIDRIDNINKARILANILRHTAKGDISTDNFLRHTWILSTVPYIDLQLLHKYKKDFYQASSSEILSSTGLVKETVIDGGNVDGSEGGSKYGLSPLGEEMLHYGLYNIEWKYSGQGRQIEDLKWGEYD